MRGMLILVFLFTLGSAFAAFSFDPTSGNLTNFTIQQDENFTWDFNATWPNGTIVTPEDKSLVEYTTDFASAGFQGAWSMNNATGVFTFTPTNADVAKTGTYVTFFLYNYTNSSSRTLDDYVQVRIYVINVNDPPSITNTTPSNLTLNVTENTSITFSALVDDPDAQYGDLLNISWYVNTTLVQNESGINDSQTPYNTSYTRLFDYCSDPSYAVRLVVTDNTSTQRSVEWTIRVENVNRNVTFTGLMSNYTWNETDGGIVNAFNVYDYFSDPDWNCTTPDPKLFTVNGTSMINVSIDNVTGWVNFTSPAYWSGQENVTITASDGYGNATSNVFTLTVVNEADPPNLTQHANETIYVGVAYETFIRAVDYDLPFGDNLTFTDNTTLFDVQWYNQSGNESYARIAFTPTSSDIGNHSILINVTDQYNLSDSMVFWLEIKANTPPVLDPIGDQTATQGVTFTLQVNGSDADGDNLTFYTNSSLFGLPYNSTVGAYQLSNVNSTSATLTFTPTNDQVGNYHVLFFTRDDKGANDSEVINFTILNVNDPPSITSPTDGSTIRVKENYPVSVNVTADDPDLAFGDTLTYSVNNTNFTLIKLSETNAELVNTTPLSIGNYSLQLSVVDNASATASITITLQVLPLLPPVLDPIVNLTAYEDQPYLNVITARDGNDDPLTFEINDTIWSAFANQTNSTSITINTTYNASQVGNYSINVTVRDPDNLTDTQIVTFTILPVDDPPIILHLDNLTWHEAVNNTYYFPVYDEENDTWNVTTNLSFIHAERFNATHALIWSVPNASHVGNYTLSITVFETANTSVNSTNTTLLTILETPEPPVILNTTPSTNITLAEGDSFTFSVNFTDHDYPFNDSVNASWYYKNTLVKQEVNITTEWVTNYTLTPGYCDSGVQNLTLILLDTRGNETRVEWQVNVTNVNRPAEFGVKRFPAENLSSMTLENLTLNASAIVLTANATQGLLTSSVIDYGPSRRENHTRFTVEGGYNHTVFLRFRTSPDRAAWTAWSSWMEANGSIPIPSEASRQRYVQFQLLVNDTNRTTRVTRVNLYFIIGNESVEKDTSYVNWIDLSYYYYDPDSTCPTPDPKNVTPPSMSIATFTVKATLQVDLIATQEGSETGFFAYNDSYNVTLSNNFTLTVKPSTIPPPVRTITRTTTTTITQQIIQTKKEEVEKPLPVDLIIPGVVTMYENDTLTLPLTIVNVLNETIEDITLSAESANENVSFSFNPEHIPLLEPGENRTVNFTLISYQTYGNYEVVITARLGKPAFNVSEKIMVNSIALGKEGEDVFNTKLASTRDLLENNPTCLELMDQLDHASRLFQAGNTSGALALLDQVREACRYLISQGENLTQPVEHEPFWKRVFKPGTQGFTLTLAQVMITLIIATLFYLFMLRK